MTVFFTWTTLLLYNSFYNSQQWCGVHPFQTYSAQHHYNQDK